MTRKRVRFDVLYATEKNGERERERKQVRRKQRGKEKERERKRQNENGVFISYSFGKKFTRRWKTTAKVHASLSISTLERFLRHLADRSAVVFCILLLCDRETFLKAQSAKLSQFETRRLETIKRERERKRAAC